MTGSTLKTFVEEILDNESVEETFFYQILNAAKVRREEIRPWRKLLTVDDSNTTSSSDTFTTMHDLADDFAEPIKMQIGENSENEFDEVGFEERYAYKDSNGYYYIDHANNQFALTGSQVGGDTIYFFYKKFSPDIASDSSWVFPDRFHSLLGFDVASYIMNGHKWDEIFSKMSPENRAQALLLEKAMVLWDTRLKLKAQGGVFGARRSNYKEGSIHHIDDIYI